METISRAILASIVCAYVAIAGMWALRVPAFAPPDEMAHTDYIFAFLDAGGFYRLRAGPSGNDVLPQTRFLERIAGYRKLRYNKFARVPAGYGSLKFFANVDVTAPSASGSARQPGSVMPYAMFLYPATYYLLETLIVRAATITKPNAVAEAFLVARCVNIGLGIGTLLFAFFTVRNRCRNVWIALLGVGGIAMLPLFCWVSAYVQPDNLVLFLVSLATWSATRKNESLTFLSVAVCGLCLVKIHYGIAIWLPSLFLALAGMRNRVSLPRAVGLLGVLPLISIVVSFNLTPAVGGLVDASATLKNESASTFSIETGSALAAVVSSVYLGGRVFTDYWLGYGTRGFYFSTSVTKQVAYALSVVSEATLIACIALYANRLRRIIHVACRRDFFSALQLVSRGFVVNSYVTYSMLLLFVGSTGLAPVGLQARYWLPLVLPLTVIVLSELPRLWPNRMRRIVSSALAIVILAITVPISLTTPSVVQRDYYAAVHVQPHYDFGGFVINYTGDPNTFRMSETSVRRSSLVTIRGFALDIKSGDPAERVSIVSDGRIVAKALRIHWDVEPAAEWHDSVLENAGFVAVIPAARFGLGRHEVKIVALRRGSALPLEHCVTLDVTS